MYIKNDSIDLTCKGKCIKCGECCGSILPLDIEDIKRLRKYVKNNNIQIQKHVLIMQSRLACPYYTSNKEKGCAVYEARPKICKFYQCNKKQITEKEVKKLVKAIPIDMWELAESFEVPYG